MKALGTGQLALAGVDRSMPMLDDGSRRRREEKRRHLFWGGVVV
jgi:hypothetical protein